MSIRLKASLLWNGNFSSGAIKLTCVSQKAWLLSTKLSADTPASFNILRMSSVVLTLSSALMV